MLSTVLSIDVSTISVVALCTKLGCKAAFADFYKNMFLRRSLPATLRPTRMMHELTTNLLLLFHPPIPFETTDNPGRLHNNKNVLNHEFRGFSCIQKTGKLMID